MHNYQVKCDKRLFNNNVAILANSGPADNNMSATMMIIIEL